MAEGSLQGSLSGSNGSFECWVVVFGLVAVVVGIVCTVVIVVCVIVPCVVVSFLIDAVRRPNLNFVTKSISYSETTFLHSIGSNSSLLQVQLSSLKVLSVSALHFFDG